MVRIYSKNIRTRARIVRSLAATTKRGRGLIKKRPAYRRKR